MELHSSRLMGCITRVLTAMTLTAAPVMAHAATGLENPLGPGGRDVPTILGNVIRAGFGIIGSIALLMFVYGGFLWLTSGGSPDRVKKGKDTMVWAVLGIAIAFAATTIVNFVIGAITGS